MKRFVLHCGLLGLFSFLAAFLASGQRTAHATAPVIGPLTSTFIVLDTWQDTNVDLVNDIPASPTYTDIQITDQSYLRSGWVVKVDEEHMLIQSLVEGGYGQPDHMIVRRGYEGTVSNSHTAGATIWGHTVTVEIYAQNVPGPDGLGAFEVDLTFPPETEYIKAVVSTSWLTSTGRTDPWCDGPRFTEYGAWKLSCSTTGATPPGPTGTGLIARVTVLPPQVLGTTVVSLEGSQLADIAANSFNAIPSDIRISTVGCPDANLDGKVSVGDLTITAKANSARGEESLALLSADITNADTQLPISEVGLLQVNDPIAIDAELMTVQAIDSGPPAVITVTRGREATPARTHLAGAIIYRDTYPSGITGTYNYTWPRDPNHDYKVSVGDLTLMARVSPLTCPAP